MNWKKLITAFSVVGLISAGVLAVYANDGFTQVKPFIYDPAKTHLVQGTWLDGIGCPTGAKVAIYPATTPTGTFTAAGCLTGDSSDKTNQGLLLAKTGPLENNASAGAVLKNVKGITLTELGYDLRKPGATQNDTRGSHCDNGAPRFNVTTSDRFLVCRLQLPAPTVEASGDGWMRLRWTTGFDTGGQVTSFTGKVQSISIVFDDGQNIGPDNFGVAILDNIDVNPGGGGGGIGFGGRGGGGGQSRRDGRVEERRRLSGGGGPSFRSKLVRKGPPGEG